MTFSGKSRNRSRRNKSVPAVNPVSVVRETRDKYGMTFSDYENMMRHERKHKKSGGGSRIYTNQINSPLRWKDVTEEAHWYGSGNASVVANNARN